MFNSFKRLITGIFVLLIFSSNVSSSQFHVGYSFNDKQPRMANYIVPKIDEFDHFHQKRIVKKTEGEIYEKVSKTEVASECITETEEEKIDISKDEIELIAMLTDAEAGGEPELGQRLVIDTVLNRVDSELFPDNIVDVIKQPNQYTPVWDGRLYNREVREDLVALVEEELENRTNYDVLFFRTMRYHDFAEPMFQVGHHYFSTL